MGDESGENPLNEALSAHLAAMDRMNETRNRAAQVETSNIATSGVYVDAGSIASMLLAVVGACLCVVAIAVVCIIAAWRTADMRELNALRDQVGDTSAYITVHEKRLNKLENPP